MNLFSDEARTSPTSSRRPNRASNLLRAVGNSTTPANNAQSPSARSRLSLAEAGAPTGQPFARERRGSAPDFTRISRAIVSATSRSISGRRVQRQHSRRSNRDADTLSASAVSNSYTDHTTNSPPPTSAPAVPAPHLPFAPVRPNPRGCTPPPQPGHQVQRSAIASPASQPAIQSLPASKYTLPDEGYDSDDASSDDFHDAQSDALPSAPDDSVQVHPLLRGIHSFSGNDSEKSGSKTTISTDRLPSTSTGPTAISDTEKPRHSETERKHVAAKAAAAAQLTTSDVMQTDDELRADMDVARLAVHKFLNSDMLEAEQLMHAKNNRLYYALGLAIIQVFKSVMTFDHDDLLTAVSYSKDAMHIASLLRKPTSAVASLGRMVRGSGQGLSSMHAMTQVQRHAELVYAESTFLKAIMGILVSGDILGFVSEALSMRSAYGVYRSLEKYLMWLDQEAAKGNQAVRSEVDEDFRSGVALGNGLISMILGLLPSKVLTIMSCFGYTGSCSEALRILMQPGQWTKGSATPGMPREREGIRRPMVDMSVLLYHLVIATFMPVQGVDVDTAAHILRYHLERYPKGVFFLYFSGRLHSTMVEPGPAIVQFAHARDVQREYLQLRHICIWDMALCLMSLGQWNRSAACFNTLLNESNWSKAVYMWGVGSNMYTYLHSTPPSQTGQVEELLTGTEAEPSVFVGTYSERGTALQHAKELMLDAPHHMQRIAGKSIPLEKFVLKKTEKFKVQGYLLLPALEFSYVYHCISHAPGTALASAHLPMVHAELKTLQTYTSDSYPAGPDAYVDDLCLAHFLHAVINKTLAYPEDHALTSSPHEPTKAQADSDAQTSLEVVASHAEQLTRDHYLAYFAQYELGRLYAARGQVDRAREAFQVVMSGKQLDRGRKGKYAMQNMALLRTNGALSMLPPAST